MLNSGTSCRRASDPYDQPVATSPPIRLEAPADESGTCGGDNEACKGCDGMPNSGVRFDVCGVCGGNSDCLDCAGVPNGNHMLDRCGECAVPVKVCVTGTNAGMICTKDQDCGAGGSCKITDMQREGWNACVDCFGVVNGDAEVDSCGKCGGSDNSCAAGYTVTPDRSEFCLGQPLVARWSAPSIRRTGWLSDAALPMRCASASASGVDVGCGGFQAASSGTAACPATAIPVRSWAGRTSTRRNNSGKRSWFLGPTPTQTPA